MQKCLAAGEEGTVLRLKESDDIRENAEQPAYSVHDSSMLE